MLLLSPLWFGNVRFCRPFGSDENTWWMNNEHNICESFPGGHDFHDYYDRYYHYHLYDPTKSINPYVNFPSFMNFSRASMEFIAELQSLSLQPDAYSWSHGIHAGAQVPGGHERRNDGG